MTKAKQKQIFYRRSKYKFQKKGKILQWTFNLWFYDNDINKQRGKKAELIKQQKPCLEGWLPGDCVMWIWINENLWQRKNEKEVATITETDGDKLSVECDAMEKIPPKLLMISQLDWNGTKNYSFNCYSLSFMQILAES